MYKWMMDGELDIVYHSLVTICLCTDLVEPFLGISSNVWMCERSKRETVYICGKGQVRLGGGQSSEQLGGLSTGDLPLMLKQSYPGRDHHSYLRHDRPTVWIFLRPTVWIFLSQDIPCVQISVKGTYSTFVVFSAPFSPKRKTRCMGLFLLSLPDLLFLSLSLNSEVVRCELFPALHSQ